MPSYTITEPHPTVAKNTYVHAGRGGAGNHFRAPQTTPSTGVPTALPPLAPTAAAAASSSPAAAAAAAPRRFYSGRGGAGNAHSHAERPVLSFEDEFSRADRRERVAALGAGYHVGRGGAGNFNASGPPGGVFVVPGPSASSSGAKKARSGSGSSVASTASSGSVGSGILRRLSGVLRH